MLDFSTMRFRYEPYPIGVARPVMDEGLYRDLVDSFPPIDLFKYMPKFGKKYTLSEKFNSRNYHDFIRSNPVWREFHAWVKSDAFVDTVLDMLKRHHIDLGLDRHREPGPVRLGRALGYLVRGRLPCLRPRLRTRFEFSALPADGGAVLPHTDTPRKIITLIVSMVREGEWREEWGGGTEVNVPRRTEYAFNWLNRQVPFEDIDTLDVFPFRPNQCVVFVKTFNSLHCVRPMTGPADGAFRRTLTMNIELDE